MRLPIRGKMILFIGLPTVAIYTAALIWVLKFAKHQVVETGERQMEHMAKIAAARFDEYISKPARVADTTARFIQRVPNLQESQIYGLLKSNVSMNDRVYGAAMAFEPGTYRDVEGLFSPYVYRDKEKGRGYIEMNIDEEAYDWYGDETTEWWHRPKNEGKGIWTAPYFDEGAGNIIMTTYSVPFTRHDNFWGVTTVDIDLETLQQEIGDTIAEGHVFFIIAPNGQFVYSPYEDETMHATIDDALDVEGTPHLRDQAYEMLNGSTGVILLDNFMGLDQVFIAHAPIPSTGWTFFITADSAELMADFHERKGIFGSAFAMALILTIATIYLSSGRVARPITNLRGKVLQIADGAEDVPLDDIRTHDEIQELAGAFATMQRKVADREAKLETARETTLSDLLESAPDAMIIVDSKGAISRSNDQVSQIFGYSREEIAKMTVEDLMPEDFRSGHGAHLNEYFAAPRTRSMGADLELHGKRKDGSEFPIEIGLSPFHEAGTTMAVAAIRDISERKEAEASLRKLNQAIEQGTAIVFITDPDGDIEYVNPRFTEVTGYTPDEAIGQTPRILKSGLQEPALYDEVWNTLTDGREWHGEFCNRKKDGSIFWVSAALSPIRDDDGNTTHFVAIEEDITKQKEIGAEIIKKEERFRTLVANLPGTVYRCLNDDDWTMQFISENVREITGYPATEFIDNAVRTYDSVISTEDSQQVADEVDAAVNKKEPWDIQYRIVRADGEIRWVGERGRAAFRDDGSVDHLDGVIIDITEAKKLSEELEVARENADAANRAKSEFLSHMSHELRTPLNGILGYSQILQRDSDITTGQKTSLDAIVNCGDHLLALINDVLDLSKIEAGRIDVDLAPCDLHKLIKSVGDVVQQRATNKGVDFNVDVSPEVPQGIVSDAPKIRQILVNLLGNAVKFTDDGEVTLRVAEKPKGSLRFDVVDSGVGMTPHELEQIFDPFKQVEAGKAAGGTGLGLSITKRLAEVLDGTLEVASEKGKGSTFTVTLPLEEANKKDLAWNETEGDSEAAHHALAPGQEFTILVADDREANRDILNQMLTGAGFDILLADDGDTAVDTLRANNDKIAIVLMDVRMPRMNGIEAIKAIRADDELKHHIVLAVTASVFPEFREKAIAAGFDGFLGKPFRMEELVALLKKHIGATFDSTRIENTPASEDESQSGGSAELTAIPAAALEKFRAALKIKNLTALKSIAEELAADPATKPAGESIGNLVRAFDFKGLDALADKLESL